MHALSPGGSCPDSISIPTTIPHHGLTQVENWAKNVQAVSVNKTSVPTMSRVSAFTKIVFSSLFNFQIHAVYKIPKFRLSYYSHFACSQTIVYILFSSLAL